MDLTVLRFYILIGITILGIISNTLSFNPIRFHCDNYVLNTYLYFVLSWAILMATNATLYSKNIELHELFSGPFTILLMVSSLALLMGLLFVPPQMFFTKHLLFIIQIVMFGIILYPYYKTNKPLFEQVSITTLLILIILTLATYNSPDYITDDWNNYLFIALLGLIIARLVEIFKNIKHNSNYSRGVSYISIVIFSLFVMYDTKKILVNAKNCVNPDYINESLTLFIDSINIFQDIFLLRSE